MTLFSTCNHPNCGAACDPENITWSYSGAMITVKATCNSNHQFNWSSSPVIGGGKSQVAAINVLVGTYAYTCGVNVKKVTLFSLNVLCQYYFSIVPTVFGLLEGCVRHQKLHLPAANTCSLQSDMGLLAVHAGNCNTMKPPFIQGMHCPERRAACVRRVYDRVLPTHLILLFAKLSSSWQLQ